MIREIFYRTQLFFWISASNTIEEDRENVVPKRLQIQTANSMSLLTLIYDFLRVLLLNYLVWFIVYFDFLLYLGFSFSFKISSNLGNNYVKN